VPGFISPGQRTTSAARSARRRVWRNGDLPDENRAKNAVNFPQAQELLKLSIAELDAAIDVLRCGGLHFDARQKLLEAAVIDAVALVTTNKSLRNALINDAIAKKQQARSLIRN
jgi:hypothetical protein